MTNWQDIKKRFKKKFVIKVGTAKLPVVGYWSQDRNLVPDSENQGCWMPGSILAFIKKTLIKELEELAGEEREIPNDDSRMTTIIDRAMKKGYNQFRNKLTQRIKELKE